MLVFGLMLTLSRWPEVIEMNNATATSTAPELGPLFASYGLPSQVLWDDGHN